MTDIESISVLFTDMVGSTELATELGPQGADELRRHHLSLLRRVIASSGGSEVKNLGDGLMVVCKGASTAVKCAVAMQQVVEADNRTTVFPAVGLRVGVSSGDATREGDDFFGEPVIEASRLCAAASGGAILASEVVKAIAARRSGHPFKELGERTLKGFPEPLKVYEVEWEPLPPKSPHAPGVPLPPVLNSQERSLFVGRREELAVLEEVWKRTLSGADHEVVLISGEAGQGKSALASQAAWAAHDAGGAVLLGRCDEDVGAPYQPFVEALDHYVGMAPEAILSEHVRSHGGELATLVPSLRQRLGPVPAPQTADPDSGRYLLFSSVAGLLQSASHVQPIMLIIDDLHWADTATLQLLRHLARHGDASAMLLVATFREVELPNAPEVRHTLGVLHAQSHVRRISLAGLSGSEVASYLETAAGGELDDAGRQLAREVAGETDGNPFFMGELLRYLFESGVVERREDGRWSIARPISDTASPQSVRDVVSARVARLGTRRENSLSVAAVIGIDFDLELLEALTSEGADEATEELIELMDEAQSAGLIVEVAGVAGSYRFSHAIVHRTLYEQIGATRRAHLHRRVAAVLEHTEGSSAAQRAHHWSRAAKPSDRQKAVHYFRMAAEAALEALAPGQAVQYYSQALSVGEQSGQLHDDLLCDLLLGLGIAEKQAGRATFRQTLLDAARLAESIGSVERLTRGALANTRGFVNALGQIDEERIAVLETALAHNKADSPERALLLATLCCESNYRPMEVRLKLSKEARAVARRVGDPGTMVGVLVLMQLPLGAPTTAWERRDDSNQALRLAEQISDPVTRYWVQTGGHVNFLRVAEFGRSRECLSAARILSDRLGQPTLLWNTLFHEAAHSLIAGNPREAFALAEEAHRIGTESQQPDATPMFYGQTAHVREQQGRMHELVELLEDADLERYGLGWRYMLGLGYLEGGETDKARAIARSEPRLLEKIPFTNLWLPTVMHYARLVIQLEEAGSAQELLSTLAPFVDLIPFHGAGDYGTYAMYLGGLASLLGRPEEADRYFARSVELCEAGDMKFNRARSQLWWAQALGRRHADEASVVSLVDDVRAASSTHGYEGLLRQATSLLGGL